jgi:hypothetical protein
MQGCSMTEECGIAERRSSPISRTLIVPVLKLTATAHPLHRVGADARQGYCNAPASQSKLPASGP